MESSSSPTFNKIWFAPGPSTCISSLSILTSRWRQSISWFLIPTRYWWLTNVYLQVLPHAASYIWFLVVSSYVGNRHLQVKLVICFPSYFHIRSSNKLPSFSQLQILHPFKSFRTNSWLLSFLRASLQWLANPISCAFKMYLESDQFLLLVLLPPWSETVSLVWVTERTSSMVSLYLPSEPRVSLHGF